MKSSIVFLAGIAFFAPLAFGAVQVSTPAQTSASASGNSFNPVFSADGHHLIYVSHANNLVTNGDLGLSLDVFVRDLVDSNTAVGLWSIVLQRPAFSSLSASVFQRIRIE